MPKIENDGLIYKFKLKRKLVELIGKYTALKKQSETYCPEFTSSFNEMLQDIETIDQICKERNRY